MEIRYSHANYMHRMFWKDKPEAERWLPLEKRTGALEVKGGENLFYTIYYTIYTYLYYTLYICYCLDF